MTRTRSTERQPAYIHARIPADLYDAVAAHSEANEISLSESLRRLLVKALQGSQLSITDEEGTHLYDRDSLGTDQPGNARSEVSEPRR